MKTPDRSVETLGHESELFKLHSSSTSVESNYRSRPYTIYSKRRYAQLGRDSRDKNIGLLYRSKETILASF